MHRHALGEVTAPPDVDTMRDDVCPVCGSTDSYNGDKCLVCGFEKPPSMMMDPDVELASQVDLRQQQQEDAVNPPPNPMGQTPDETPDLVCPSCGMEFSSAEQDQENGDPFFATTDEQQPAVNDLMDPNAENEEAAPNTGGPQPEQVDQDNQDQDEDVSPPMDDSDDKEQTDDTDQDDDSQNPFPPKKKKTSAKNDDDSEDKDDSTDEEDTEDNNTDTANDVVGDDDPPGDQQVDPTNSDQPEVANGNPQGMNDTDPNAQDPVQQEQMMQQQQYADDLNSDSQTGYEAGDICPNCGQGILEPIGNVEVNQDEENPIDTPPSDQEDNDPNDPQSPDEGFTPKTSGLNNLESLQRMSNPAHSRRSISMEKNPAAQRRSELFTALNQNAKALRNVAAIARQERLLRQAAEARTATLEQQIFRLASLVGADEDPVLRDLNEQGFRNMASLHNQAAKIRVTADERDPGEPVPEPPTAQPVVTEQEAAQPAARADVTQLGATPITDVSADATIAVDQPYGETAFMPLELNEVDVTAPVNGTQGHLPPEQTIVPVEVRVGDPDQAQPSFPITWGNQGPIVGPGVGTGGPEVQRAPGSPPAVQGGTTASVSNSDRTYASMNLARLRIKAGLVDPTTDDLVLAQSIDKNSSLEDGMIHQEIELLKNVIKGSQNQGKTAARNLVPRSTTTDPSLGGGQGPIQSHASYGAVSSDEFWDE